MTIGSPNYLPPRATRRDTEYKVQARLKVGAQSAVE